MRKKAWYIARVLFMIYIVIMLIIAVTNPELVQTETPSPYTDNLAFKIFVPIFGTWLWHGIVFMGKPIWEHPWK
jgi:hypothetical protein